MNTSPSPSQPLIRTGSKLVLDYLRSLPSEEEFSRLSISRALPDVGEGAISGFLSKLKSNGKIKLSSRKPSVNGFNRLEHYTIAETENLDDISTRNSSGVGGKVGRQSLKATTNRQRLVDLLMSVAEDIERMPISLADYTTKELLKEIETRTRHAEEVNTNPRF